MTLCIAIKCGDGILLCCDSRTVYGRGVPVSREMNKIYILDIEGIIKNKIAVMGAGTVAFIDKFIRMFRGSDIKKLANDIGKDELRLSEIINKFAEPITSAICDEYINERKIIRNSPFDMIICGFESEEEPDAFILYGDGLAEPIYDFGTIGSGAAYAELFLRHLLPSSTNRKIENAIEQVCYTIRLVETIDPYVGGKINLAKVTSNGIEYINSVVNLPRDKAERALQSAMSELKEILDRKR